MSAPSERGTRRPNHQVDHQAAPEAMTALWIGAVGLSLVTLFLLLDGKGLALGIADVGIGVLITLALLTHVAFHRRHRQKHDSDNNSDRES